jgi:hypothetical protein
MSTEWRVRTRPASVATEAEISEEHTEFIEVMRISRNEAITLGALGLAAWGVLFTQSPLDRYSLDILLVGVVVIVCGPLIFRTAGTEGTRMGLESALSIGYASIAIALLAFLPSALTEPRVNLVGFFVATVLVVRECRDVRSEIQRTLSLVSG